MSSPTVIFVFGSNREGRHGKGAALEARNKWGAIYGKPYGLQGRSYAIVTKELRPCPPHHPVSLAEIELQVVSFLKFAETQVGDMVFHVTPIGCGLAGFKPSQIAPLFKKRPSNVFLPTLFLDALGDPHP